MIFKVLLGYALAKAGALALLKGKPIYVGTRLAALAWGDGRTDDVRAFQKALNVASGGGTVKLPPGTFVITETLHVPRAAIIEGAGFGDSRLDLRTSPVLR